MQSIIKNMDKSIGCTIEKSVVWNENIKYNNYRWADLGASEMSALIRVTILLQ